MKLTWYYPSRLEEVPQLLKGPNVLIHGGGTGLLTRNLSATRGLVDTGRLPLFGFKSDRTRFELGSALTYDQTVKELCRRRPRHLLVQALSQAASNPLRHRITLGGSVAAAPLWSDLIGPLLALEADLVLIGGSEGVFALERYLEDRELKKQSLITAIHFSDPGWIAGYHRETLTHFDYPAFTLTVLLRREADRIADLRLVLTGTTTRSCRLRGLEKKLTGAAPADLGAGEPRLPAEVRFAAKKLGSPDYLRALAELALKRTLGRLLRS
jgi:CO/xanthine dehydrogenase FAD-binding subunit